MRSMAATGGEQSDLGGFGDVFEVQRFFTLKAASFSIIVPIDQVSN